MTKFPAIGIEDAQSYFRLDLCPAYARFREVQTRVNALSVAQSAWALIEWRWNDKGRTPPLEQFRTDLFTKCPELRLLRDYAEAGKHVGLDRTDVEFDGITGAESPGGTFETSGPQMGDAGPFRGRQHFRPQCTLVMNHGGKTHSLPDVLHRVVEFWSRELSLRT